VNSQSSELSEVLKGARLNAANLVVVQRPTVSGQYRHYTGGAKTSLKRASDGRNNWNCKIWAIWGVDEIVWGSVAEICENFT